MHRFEAIDLRQSGVKVGLDGKMGHDDQRHRALVGRVIQHDPGDDAPEQSPVPLVIMTHLAIQADLYAALSEIDRLETVHAPSVCLGVED